jgi:hypothetical protein
MPKPTVEITFEVVVDGKVHRVAGRGLQRWILKQRQELKGPAGFLFSKRRNLVTRGGDNRPRRRDNSHRNCPSHRQIDERYEHTSS